MKPYDYLVVIGRFQIPHRAHFALLRKAFELSTFVIVILGSDKMARTVKNPFTTHEREEMIRSGLTDNENGRIEFGGVRDYPYNDQQWIADIQSTVDRVMRINSWNLEKGEDELKIGMMGHRKDHSSFYLDYFPQWELNEFDNVDDLNSTEIRNMYLQPMRNDSKQSEFAKQSVDKLFHTIELPEGVRNFLVDFRKTEEFAQLVREQRFLLDYRMQWNKTPYPVTFNTADAVVFQAGHILLIRRKAEPGAGLLALPGGFIGQNERVLDAAVRELREETKLKVPAPVLYGSVKATKTFDAPGRSLRGRTITHAFLIVLSPGPLPKVKGNDDARSAHWVPLGELYKLEDQFFEDHFAIINDMIGKI